MSMGEFLHKEFDSETLAFSLYKKRGVVYTYTFLPGGIMGPHPTYGIPFTPIDYKANDVRTIITELDSRKHIENPEDYYTKNFKTCEETLDIFDNINKDKHVLASYVSISGEGVRIIFQVDKPIKNDLEYLSNLYYYTKYFKEKYDKKNCMCLDFTCDKKGNLLDINHSDIYWYPPTKKDLIYVNKDSTAVKKI